MVKPFLAFLAVCLLVAFTAWMGGYNFDHRGEGVGFATYMTLVVAIAIALGVHLSTEQDE